MSDADDVLKSLGDSESVPTLKAAATMVLDEIDAEDSDLAKVSDLISQDPAMASQILRLSNSILYNASGMSTTSIHDAVSRLGSSQVRGIVISLAVVDAFREVEIPIDFPAFWRHCFTTALAAGQVASRSPTIKIRGSARDNPYFLAGLLHDIGTLVLCQELGDEYVEILEIGIDRGIPLQDVERERLGFDHQDVGAALIRRWGLPFEVAAAAEFHHRVGDAPAESSDYVLVTHAANLIGTGRGLPEEEQPVSEPLALEALGIQTDALPELVEDVGRAAADANLLLQIAQSG